MNATAVSALDETIAAALARFPQERARIERGAQLASVGAVTLGCEAARVTSQTDASTSYLVTDDSCECQDSRRHPGQSCKHRWAVDLILVAEERTRRLALRATEQADRALVTADAVALAYAEQIGWTGPARPCVQRCGAGLPAEWAGNLCASCADAIFAHLHGRRSRSAA